MSSAESGATRAPHAPPLVACTFVIFLNIFFLGQRHKPSISSEMQRRRSDIGKDAGIPKIRRYYHMEYFLLPDDIEPRKLDLVLFGMVAKFFLESESKVVKPWFENDQIWVSWNHRIDINVTNEFLTKLREHKITLKLWDTRDKVCAKAKFSKPRISYSQAEDVDAIGNLCFILSRHHTKLKGKPDGKKEYVILNLFPIGEKSVTSRLKEKSPKVLDTYLTFTVETPLMSERQRCELNPLIIRILSATYLPTTPVPIEQLQESCVPTYCRYRFHDLPPHQTQGQMHGTHVYFKDVNVVLTGTIKPAKLYEYLRGPPMEIEVHDRDQKTVEDPKKSSLFGEEQDDTRLSNIGFLTYKHSVQNPFTDKNKLWDSYGVAKVSLNDLLLGEKYLNISVPIHSCSIPDPTIYQKDNKNEKMAGVSQPVNGLQASPLPVGHYLEFDSLLKVRVEIAVPLGPQAGPVDSKVADCPYGCIIYIFDYKNASFLHDLLQEITGINAKALQLDCFPLQIAQKALATFRLKTKLKEISELDIITGFHILDGKIHLLVLEGLKDKAIKSLWDQHSNLSLYMYDFLNEIMLIFFLQIQLISDNPQFLVGDNGKNVINVFVKLLYIVDRTCYFIQDVIHGNLLPSAEMITVLSQEFGIPLTNEDLFVQKPSLLSLPSFGFPKQTEIANIDAVYLLNKKVKRPILKTARSFPDDGKSVYNYSSQRLNSAEFAKKLLRQEMAKKPERRFAYCHEYLSAMFDPVDLDTVWKESVEESKNRSLSPNGFIIPGFKSTIESNLLSQSSDEVHLKEVREVMQENMFANFLEPVLNRDAWSSDKRHLDFDLYKKPPDYFTVSAPADSQTGN
uniref:Cilia and flagella associated protein 92 (putative) n=1 Tax=Crocodylus porosus TaxID=8502 RepID=A0A7M4FPK4_CROPO